MMNSSNQLYKKITICFLVALFAAIVTIIVMNPPSSWIEDCDLSDVKESSGTNWTLDMKMKHNDIEQALFDKLVDGKGRCKVRIKSLPKKPLGKLLEEEISEPSRKIGSQSESLKSRCCIDLGGWLTCSIDFCG